ncbi:MAG: hypothetical protein VB100_01415 [Angelakisella sp.]|nr:hypothetical protein [Angelakisella sp.]
MKKKEKPHKEPPVLEPRIQDEPAPVIAGGLTSPMFASVDLSLDVQRQLAQHAAAERLAD